ncbi:hypothetical protein HDU98_004075 [Podochytrium sp. JEL0797]|nr:hypothetical protein HDU98_004075 [Podochytrium sp. JEL0797]
MVLAQTYKISDLVGKSSRAHSSSECPQPSEYTLYRDKARRSPHPRVKKPTPILSKKSIAPKEEPSSFIVSNRIAMMTASPSVKAKTNSNGSSIANNASTDVLYLHKLKIKQFDDQYEVQRAKLESLLEKATDVSVANQLHRQLKKLNDRDDLCQYYMQTQTVVNEYLEMLESGDPAHLKIDTTSTGHIDKWIVKFDNVEKQRLTEKYCQIVNNGLMMKTVSEFDRHVCSECQGETQIKNGFIVCCACGSIDEHNVPEFQASYRDYQDSSYKTPFSYKRSNRFHEILANLQGKETTEIPPYVIEAVRYEIRKEHSPDPTKLTREKVRCYLKKLSMSQYYEHIPCIMHKITGIAPVQLSPQVEEKLIDMFNLIQLPFETVRAKVAPSRSSFLSYNYSLSKFCELLDLHQYASCFTLLKSVDKLRVQDAIWKGICEILEWEYIPSV